MTAEFIAPFDAAYPTIPLSPLIDAIDDKNTIELPFPILALLSQKPFVNCIFEKFIRENCKFLH